LRLGAEADLLEILGKFLGDEVQDLLRSGVPAAYSMPA
jgi:5-methylcytosine-specific restriction endonuclease McrBC regulatory subunit McrC